MDEVAWMRERMDEEIDEGEGGGKERMTERQKASKKR